MNGDNSSMTNPHRSTTMIAAFIMVLLVGLNLASALLPINPGSGELTQPVEQIDEGVPAANELEEDLIEGVGGLTTNTGIAVITVSLIMFMIAIGLFTGRGWQMGAMLALGADISFKLVNIIAQLAIGEGLGDVWLSVVVIVVEAAAIGLLFRDWSRNRDYAPQTEAKSAVRTTQEEG